MKVTIIIPTYNEAQNIVRLINVLSPVINSIHEHTISVLVVDGKSPDGTAAVVQKIAESKPWLSVLIQKQKNGIGGAYFEGFKYAMDKLQVDAVVEMDGDFQHDPADLPALLAPLNKGYDYVVGSRFVKGGSIPSEWALYRKLFSIGGSIFSKFVLGIYNVNDFTTGFKVTRVKGFLDKIDFDRIKSKGFAYKIELLYRMHLLGAKIIEVPIKFGMRDKGNSKMEGDNLMDCLSTVVTLRIQNNIEFFRFLAVGCAGFITDSGLFNSLVLFKITPGIAALISGMTAILVTFILNNRWSFGARKITSLREQISTFPLYLLVSIIPIFVRSKLIILAISTLGNHFFVYNAAFLVGVILGLVWNYIIYSKVIWMKKR